MKRFLGGLMLLGLAALSARAELIVVLDIPVQIGNPGGTLFFTGILSNDGPSTVYLNSAQLNLAGNDFSAEFSDQFIQNVPVSLDPGQSSSSIELFDILVNDPFTDAAGAYNGKYQLLGGIDFDAQDVLGSADFLVNVNATSAAPEPSLLGVIVGGLAGLITLRRRK
jgi:hypothetical protein